MPLADTAKLIASLELQDKFTGPARNAEAALGRLEGRASTLGRVGSEAGRGLGNLATNVARIGVFAGGAAATGLVAAVNAASDLNEEIDKSSVVFGRAATRVQDFSEAAAAIGLAQSEALGAAGAFGNMFNTIGLAADESADMSIAMVKLAADMASFNNEDPSEMLDKLRSGLSGEAEPLRRFGVLLSEVTVREFAFRTGIARTGTALTEAQKVQARYGLILEQTAIQQGNFADTSESMANQQRILRANITNTGAVIGTALLPKISEVINKVNELVIANRPFIEDFAATLPAVFDRAAALISNLPWDAIGSSFQLMGMGADALLTAFTSLPPWVQTAVITGWGLNKLTGGALGNIVGTLASGLIKGVLGVNAGVVNINAGVVNGGVPGAGPVAGRAAGAGRLLFGLTGVGLAAMLADEFEEEIQGLAEDIHDTFLSSLPTISPNELEWPFGPKNTPTILPEVFGDNGLLGGTAGRTPGTASFSGPGALATQRLLNGFSEARNSSRELVSEIRPLVGVLEGITTTFTGSQRVGGGNFVPSVKLDPSMVTDLREPTRLAYQQLIRMTADAQAADTANRTWNRTLTFETINNRQQTIARLTTLAAKYDATSALIRNQTGVLGQIRDKSTLVKVNVQNNIQVGVSEIQYRIQSVTQSVTGVTGPTSPVAI